MVNTEKVLASISLADDTGSGSVDKSDAPLDRLAAWAENLSVETNGIERVTEEQREQNTTKVWNACTFW